MRNMPEHCGHCEVQYMRDQTVWSVRRPAHAEQRHGA